MATYSNNVTISINSAVAQTLGTYNVPAGSYFMGQAALDLGSTGHAEVTVGGVTAATLYATNAAPTSGGNHHSEAPIVAGPGQAITTGTVTYGGNIILTGVVFINTP